MKILSIVLFLAGCGAATEPCKDKFKNVWDINPYSSVSTEETVTSKLQNGCYLHTTTYYVGYRECYGCGSGAPGGGGPAPGLYSVLCSAATCNDSNRIDKVSDPFDIRLVGKIIFLDSGESLNRM